jgi:hypothetical protein
MDHASSHATAPSRGNATLAAVGFAVVGAAAAVLGYMGTSDALLSVAAGSVAALACWMLVSDRYERTLLVLLVYMGLFDGILKLRLDRGGVTLLRDALLYSIVLGAVARWVSRREGYRWPPYSAWVAAWVGVVVIQLVNDSNGTLRHSLAALRPHLEFVPLFFLGYEVLRNERRLRTFFVALAAIAGINGVVAVYQVQLTRPQLADWGPGYAHLLSGSGDLSPRAFTDSNGVDHPRPPALGGDMGFSGTLGALAAPGALAFLWWTRRRRRVEFLLAMALLAGVGLAIAVSASRLAVIEGAAGMFALGVLAVVSTRRTEHAIAMAAAGAAIIGLAWLGLSQSSAGIFDRYRSITPNHFIKTAYDYRKDSLKQVPTYARDFPFGAGLGSVGPAAGSNPGTAGGKGANGETEFTFLMVELGIGGLLVLLLMHLLVLRRALGRVHRLPAANTRLFVAALGASVFGLFVGWLAGPTTANSPGAPFLWLALGALAYWLGDQVASHSRRFGSNRALRSAA